MIFGNNHFLAVKEVQDNTQHHAQQDTADDGKVEAAVFAFDKNIAG